MIYVMRIICNCNDMIAGARVPVAGLAAVCYRSGQNQTQ